jgi:hypothetical protein
MRLFRVLFIATIVSIVTGCGVTHPITCSPSEHAVVVESLYFGTAKSEGIVTAEEWKAFVGAVVTPAFPDGFTTWAASGQWRMSTGTIRQEPSHVLQLTHDGSPQNDRAIEHIMKTYKDEFRQEAVMRVHSQACRSF